MPEVLSEQLRDPVGYALPVFLLFIGLELLALRFTEDEPPRRGHLAVDEFVFNTPSHHRVHHGSDPEYLDRNYAGILILWDRMFGTFAAERQRPRYGLTYPVNTYNPLRLQFGEYAAIDRDVRRTRRWRDRAGYLFGPPGWSPAAGA